LERRFVEDADYMRRALVLAERGRGAVEPNPLVGAVFVKNGRVIAEGYHRRFGGPHAEVDALSKLPSPTSARGATLYLTLEPCTFYGKTPPCVDALIKAKVGRVFIATDDPNPKVSGAGIKKLRRAGVEVRTGLLKEDARYQNAPYFKLVKTGLPFVTLKWAMSIDGKSATRIGRSRWISNERSRVLVHKLRGVSDAILVGVGTVVADDPLLTPRYFAPRRRPRRIIADSTGRIPLDSAVVTTANEYPTLIATTNRCTKRKVSALRNAGCRVRTFRKQDGRVNLRALLRYLGKKQMTNILVEGGGRIAASLLEKRLVDRVLVFIAPILLGGEEAKTPVEGEGVAQIEDALRGNIKDIRRIDDNILLQVDLPMPYLSD